MTVELLNMVTLKSVCRKTLASDNFAMIITKRNAFLFCYDKIDKK